MNEPTTAVIELSEITIEDFNPRSRFDKDHDIVQAPTVRPAPDGGYIASPASGA